MAYQYISRRGFLKSYAAGASALLCNRSILNQAIAATKNTKRPNILLYVADDQGSDDAGCYGNSVIKTPGLDTLAREGTRFTHSFCTTASCSASRSVILSGLHNHANGQYGLAHGYHNFSSFKNITTLPVLLAEAGYRTASAGKYHVIPESAYHFQKYIDQGAPHPEKMADDCRDYIAAEDSSPFFLYFCPTDPHRPFARDGSDVIKPEDVIVPSYLPDMPQCREELAEYYGSVQRADKGLLRLIDILKKTGRWDNTIVIYISDNGIAFPGAKTTLYEPGTRLPCVVRNPYQTKRGVVCNAMITWADLTPTILDFAGVSPEKYAFHGRSFSSILEEENPSGWDEIYASHTFHEVTMYYPMRAVRGRQYKLIWNIAHELPYPFASDLWESKTWQAILQRGDKYYGKRAIEVYIHRPEFELYDLKQDPDEINNLADDTKYEKVLAELKDKLKMFQQRTKDPWILKWKHE
jgi:N-sulfoglucosamine sulfohydrolase